jgi:hypothetical protein
MKAPALLCLIFASVALGQQAQGTLTNQRIGDMVLAGVSQTEVIRVISSATTISFDLRPSSTDSLLKVGVSEDIIKAMAARESGFMGQLSLAPVPSRIASVPTDTDKGNHRVRTWVIIGIAGLVAGGLAYTGYRLANPHHCSADYILGTPVTNPAARTPSCN